MRIYRREDSGATRAEPIGRCSVRQPGNMHHCRPCEAGTHTPCRCDVTQVAVLLSFFITTKAGGYGSLLSQGRHQDYRHIVTSSIARRSRLGKPPADAQQEFIADLTIGLQLLLAIALRAGGSWSASIPRRPPAFASVPAPVMRLRRQRNDQVEVEPFPIGPVPQVVGLWPAIILAEFRHHGDANGSSSPFLTPADLT